MTDTNALATALASPINFSLGAVRHDLTVAPVRVTPAPLGPLAAFTGNWIGNGFNTIFRPLGIPDTPENPADAVLELNLTSETMSFAPNLVSIPNRGFDPQK